MKRLVSLATVALFSALAAFPASADTVAKGPIDATAELIALSEAWTDAEVRHDRPALERILDEQFLLTYSSGKTIDRTAFIDWILRTDIKPFEVLTESVKVHGETAVVISTTKDRATKFTWIAIRKDGRWRVISETFTKVAAP